MIGSILGKDVRVVLPDSAAQNYPPFWTKNNITGEMAGYFVDVMREIFRHTGIPYTIADNSNFTSYPLLSIQSRVAKLAAKKIDL